MQRATFLQYQQAQEGVFFGFWQSADAVPRKAPLQYVRRQGAKLEPY